MEDKRRDPTFDIMKGLAIIFVVMLHSSFPIINVKAFDSLRVPLFFIISGYFAKECMIVDFIKKDAKKLVIPYIVCSIAMFPIAWVGGNVLESPSLKIAVLSMVLGSSSYTGTYEWIHAGPFWFLLALLWVRLFWCGLVKIKSDVIKGVIVIFLGVASYIAKFYITLPWSILSAFGAMGFFYAGYIIKKYDLLNNEIGKKIFPISFLFLIYCILYSKIDINYCIYKSYYIIDLLGCIGGFAVLWAVINRYSCSNSGIWRGLNFIGRYSLIAFCVHGIDQCINVHWLPFKFWDTFNYGYERFVVLILRLIIVFVGTLVLTKSRFIKEKIFFVK